MRATGGLHGAGHGRPAAADGKVIAKGPRGSRGDANQVEGCARVTSPGDVDVNFAGDENGSVASRTGRDWSEWGCLCREGTAARMVVVWERVVWGRAPLMAMMRR